MSQIKRARPSPALIVAVLALVAALAGTAVAGSGPEATTSALSTKDVKKIAKQQGKKQAKKQIKKTLPIGGSELGSITEVVGTPITIPAFFNATATAKCPEGTKVIGGGYQSNSNGTTMIALSTDSRRTDNGWLARGEEFGGAPTTWTAIAYCLEG